jgi:NosR/NirI family transcriptional regulator, nitrous oxide reductase regulator
VKSGLPRSWPEEKHLRALIIALSCFVHCVGVASAQDYLTDTPPLIERLTPEVLAGVYQEATRVESLDDGGPTAAAAYVEDELVGYVFSTLDVLRAPGYSPTPFDVIAGVSLGGRITGAAVLFHREPYLLNDDRRTGQLIQFLDNMQGMEGRLGASGGLQPNFVAGATISARAMRNAVLDGARLVLRYRSEGTIITEPTVDTLNFRPLEAPDLIADGAVATVNVTNADLAVAMERAGLADLPAEVPPRGDADALYIDFRAGYAVPPTIGRNLAGQVAYDRLHESFAEEGRHALIFASSGTYDYRGTKYNNLSHGFRLERIAVEQGAREYRFDKWDLINVNFELGGISNIVLLPPDSGFDPMQPWRADLYAHARRPDGSLEPFRLASVDYALPAQFILMPEPEPMAAWMEPWIDGKAQIVTLGAALGVLTLILGLQAPLSRRRRVHRWVRNGFLLFTLVWLGWIASAQLSIVHVINYLEGPFRGLGADFFLAEPLIVMISAYAALSLILLGRGVFCGWLCPFGALQELLANLARALRLPQWNPSERLQGHLWKGKYVSLALVVGLALLAPAAGAVAAEIEPFKTAITAMFVRGWPYLLYAALLLLIGLFTERAFCRFLCPLGGALALLGRLRMFDLLKRRPECGNPCHLCERACPVRAIHSDGRINMDECFQCLDCQVEYHDDRRCPPLAKLRKLKERGRAPAERPAARPQPPAAQPIPAAARVRFAP